MYVLTGVCFSIRALICCSILSLELILPLLKLRQHHMMAASGWQSFTHRPQKRLIFTSQMTGHTGNVDSSSSMKHPNSVTNLHPNRSVPSSTRLKGRERPRIHERDRRISRLRLHHGQVQRIFQHTEKRDIWACAVQLKEPAQQSDSRTVHYGPVHSLRTLWLWHNDGGNDQRSHCHLHLGHSTFWEIAARSTLH